MHSFLDLTSVDWKCVDSGYFVITQVTHKQNTYKLEVYDKTAWQKKIKESKSNPLFLFTLDKIIPLFNQSQVNHTIQDFQIAALKFRLQNVCEKHNVKWLRCLRYLILPKLVAFLCRSNLFKTYQLPTTPAKEAIDPFKKESISAFIEAVEEKPFLVPPGDEFYYDVVKIVKNGNQDRLERYFEKLSTEEIDQIFEKAQDKSDPSSDCLISMCFKYMELAKALALLDSILLSEEDVAKKIVSSIGLDVWEKLIEEGLESGDLASSSANAFLSKIVPKEKKQISARLFIREVGREPFALRDIFKALPNSALMMNDIQLGELVGLLKNDIVLNNHERLLCKQFQHLPDREARLNKISVLFGNRISDVLEKCDFTEYDWLKIDLSLLKTRELIKSGNSEELKSIFSALSNQGKMDYARHLVHVISQKESSESSFMSLFVILSLDEASCYMEQALKGVFKEKFYAYKKQAFIAYYRVRRVKTAKVPGFKCNLSLCKSHIDAFLLAKLIKHMPSTNPDFLKIVLKDLLIADTPLPIKKSKIKAICAEQTCEKKRTVLKELRLITDV